VLLLSNSEEMEARIADDGGVVARLEAEHRPTPEIKGELYLGALGRFPTEAERNKALAHVAEADNPRPALEDLLWVLLNSKEFIFNH
jgi:hypothetical protein